MSSAAVTTTIIDPAAALREAAALTKLGDAAGALKVLDAARQQSPDQPDILFAMARLFQDLNQPAAAARLYEVLIDLRPRDAAIRNNYANTLHTLARLPEAAEQIKAALTFRVDMPELWVTQGVVAQSAGALDQAEQAFTQALTLQSDHPAALSGLAAVHSSRGHISKAVLIRERALHRLPDRPSLRVTQAYDLFRLERWAEAWDHYAARLEAVPGEPAVVARRPFTMPVWNGQPLPAGQSLLVWMEQGIGEELMYAGLLADAAKICPSMIVECERRLLPLFRRSFPQLCFVTRRDPPDPDTTEATVGAQIAAADLGRLFRRSAGSFPVHHGYLRADPARVERLREHYRLGAPGKQIIGISWRSKPYRYADLKSSALADWAALFTRPNAHVLSLQYGDQTAELREAAAYGWHVAQDMTIDPLHDMDAFAAQVAACDHIITVSNATAHIAGALGVKAHVLLPHGAGAMHHWLGAARTGSPWYPSLKLWRQKHLGDWKSVIEAVAAGL